MADLSLEDQGKARWDEYRRNYPDMTYVEVANAHDWVWENYPDQSHHSTDRMDEFFDTLTGKYRVLEVGGWRGEAADRQLLRRDEIQSWINYEICEAAVHEPVTQDPRYKPRWPENWVWTLQPPGADVAVLSHVIEHVSDEQLPLLLRWVAQNGVHSMYIEAPMHDEGQSWYGGNTAHVLTLGWRWVVQTLEELGYSALKVHAKLDHYVLFVNR